LTVIGAFALGITALSTTAQTNSKASNGFIGSKGKSKFIDSKGNNHPGFVDSKGNNHPS